MLESVINLGIKGSDLVASTLSKLQKQKQGLTKKTDVQLGSKSFGEKLKARREERKAEREDNVKLPTKADREQEAKYDKTKSEKADNESKPEKPEKPKKEESDYGKNLKSELAGAKAQAISAIQQFNGTGLAQAGVKAVSSAIPVIGTAIGEAFNSIVDAVVAFKDKIKQQSAIVADTAAKNNDITNSLKGKKFEDMVKGRKDISKSEQATIISSISGSMGKLSNDFQKAIGGLYQSEDGKKKYDVAQSTSLAQGNFSALGNDKGFFMQQISSGFSGLPPSVKQKLTSQMFGMITPEERDVQNDYGNRSTQTAFDNLDRTQAEKYVGAGGAGNNEAMALKIQDSMYKLDMKVAEGMSAMIQKVNNIAKAPDTGAAMLAEFKSSVADLGNSIKSIFRGGG